MATTLSELLERIRPAGAPGAPSEGALQRQHDHRATEVASLAACLAIFEAEADAVVAEAAAEAERLRAEGERTAREILSSLATKAAVAESDTAAAAAEQDRPGAEQIEHGTEETIAALQARAAIKIPELVDAVIATIWSQIPTSPSSELRP